jgi:hypothetical protein
VKQEKGKGGRKEKEAPTGGVTVSAVAGKKKRRKKWRAAAGEDVGPMGRCGLKGNEVRFSHFFFFFFKLFSNQTFSTQIQTKLFKLFHKIL